MNGVLLVGVEPIFYVSGVERSVAPYEQILGFTTSRHDPTYAFAHWGDFTIHLAYADPPTQPGGSAIYLHVDDADHLAEEWWSSGAAVVRPQDFEYGRREGSHTDPDGNLIRFGSPTLPV